MRGLVDMSPPVKRHLQKRLIFNTIRRPFRLQTLLQWPRLIRTRHASETLPKRKSGWPSGGLSPAFDSSKPPGILSQCHVFDITLDRCRLLAACAPAKSKRGRRHYCAMGLEPCRAELRCLELQRQ